MQNELPYSMPFPPYNVQTEMIQTINKCLHSYSPVIPIAALEVPTGCGKTLALLSSTLRYQALLEKLTPQELKQHLLERQYKKKEIREINNNNNNSENENDENWSISASFFKLFRGAGTTNNNNNNNNIRNKKMKVELNGGIVASSELRRQHEIPPCTIFYITRTHSQLKQIISELRKLKQLHRLKMNILGSRERYCINPTITKARVNKTLPVEGNNLGEICDKLVSLGQCEAVHNYTDLASQAITRSICNNHNNNNNNNNCKDKTWDIEDLVLQGISSQSCPYYAARDLIFFVHINFATYSYLLDPLIRHECKMEAALGNNSIIIFDEAHNVSNVCQDALSVEISIQSLRIILSEIEPLIATSISVSTLSYPREFKLTHWTLVELFSLLYDIFNSIINFVEKQDVNEVNNNNNNDNGDNNNEREKTMPGETIANIIKRCIIDYSPIYNQFNNNNNNNNNNIFNKSSIQLENIAMFRQIYGIVMSLGVTFNPFNFSIFALSIMKRWLLIMRFILQRPDGFAINIKDITFTNNNDNNNNNTKKIHRNISIRCLDGSLAFHHLLNSVHRIILASGTLAPFEQLAKELNISISNMVTYEGTHVVKDHQFYLSALTHMNDGSRLHCTYKNFSNISFINNLVSVIITLIDKVPTGGILIFFPNYNIMYTIASKLQTYYRTLSQNNNNNNNNKIPHIFIESKSPLEFPQILHDFQLITTQQPTQNNKNKKQKQQVAILTSVFRAKVSEGINFNDHMARLIISVGLPLQPMNFWSVKIQKKFSGDCWYLLEAMRAVNQALGRCLRHINDYGAIILLEDRLGESEYINMLSKWCRGNLKVRNSSEIVGKELELFYNNMMKIGSNNNNNNNGKIEGEESKDLLEESMKDIDGSHNSVINNNNNNKEVSSHLEVLFPFSVGNEIKKRPRVTTKTHLWSSTAIKLLYESHNSAEEVTAAELREVLHLLEDEYSKDKDDE